MSKYLLPLRKSLSANVKDSSKSQLKILVIRIFMAFKNLLWNFRGYFRTITKIYNSEKIYFIYFSMTVQKFYVFSGWLPILIYVSHSIWPEGQTNPYLNFTMWYLWFNDVDLLIKRYFYFGNIIYLLWCH